MAWAGVVVLTFVGAVAISQVLIMRAKREAVLARLPETPDLSDRGAALTRLVAEAERDLRDGPLGPSLGRLGNLYQANFFYDEAAVCYDLAMEVEPENAKWPYFRAFVRQMKGDTGGMMSLLDRTIELDPHYSPALLRRADNLYKTGSNEAAREDYQRCLDLKPSDQYALLGLARIALDSEQWEEAEADLTKAVQIDPGFGVAHRLLASVHGHFGRTEAQRKALARADAAGRFFPAPDPWIDSLEDLCYHPEQLLMKAFIAGNTEQARDLYRRVIAMDPDDGEAYWRLGTLLLQLHEPGNVEELFRKALELGVDDETRYPVIHSNLGTVLYSEGRIDEAVSHFERALELDPDFETAQTSLGAALTQLDRPQGAIEHCKKALAINPKSDAAYYNWGLALLKTGQDDLAADRFREAIRLNPSLVAANYQLGVFCARKGKHTEAAEHFRRALKGAEDAGDRALAARIRAILAQGGR